MGVRACGAAGRDEEMARFPRLNESAGAPVVPQSYRVAYRCTSASGGSLRTLEVEGCDSVATQDLQVAARVDAETLAFEVTPTVPLTVESFQVTFEHAFAKGELVLLNGYQSWTTTDWRPATESMRGLAGVPSLVIDRYAIDGIGDYRFAEYGGSGVQHGYTYGLFRVAGHDCLLASLDESHGFTLIRTDAQAGAVTVATECPARVLEPGQAVELGRYALLEGAGDGLYDRWLELAGISARPVRPLVGYSSWYRHYGEIDQWKLASDLEGAANAFARLNTGAATRLFQVDDGFCTVGDWLRPDAAKFPDGMGELAARIHETGFLPGLWMAPFVCSKGSRLFAEHADWLLRDESGSLVRTGPHWDGAYALDTRNAEVRAYVRESLQTATREWGFGLLKLDFLYAACMVPHDGMNRGELMRDAMELLREAVGEDVLLLGCGVPLGSVFGMVDYCRIGCDVGLDWDDKPHMRLLHRERVSTKHSMENTISRAPLDGRVFGNDPDVFFLRDDVKFSARRRLRLLETDAQYGSMLLTSDDMGAWGAAERAQFQEALHVLLQRKG